MKSMVSSDKKLANAFGGKSVRACDNCIRKRARWYCAADDAFLCQACDSSVHSANPLAKRHERVRLKTTSIKSFSDESRTENISKNTTKISSNKSQTPLPSWHRGFTRKARTPRHKKTNKPFFSKLSDPLHLVPDSEENSHDENDEQLLYRVPIYHPFAADLCNSNEAVNNTQGFGHELKTFSNEFSQEINHLHDFLPSEMDLAEFAADVESLLGKGLEDESFDMESLGLLDTSECSLGTERVKDEDEDIGEVVNHEIAGELIDFGRETFELNFNYDSPINREDDDVKLGEPMMMVNNSGSLITRNNLKKSKILSLDYEGVLSAWDSEKSPWTTGERPELNSGDCICWPNCMGKCGNIQFYGDMGLVSGHIAAMAGREARVSRYREKRRTRLFSKKIRYEVRKLNAEKRPRMKGRFVKRENLVARPLMVNK